VAKFGIFRFVGIIVWAAVLAASVGSYLYNPRALTAEGIAAFFERFETGILLAYTAFSILRGFTLLPSTPMVIAGTLLFPRQSWLVLSVSITGILVSSTMIYFWSDLLGFSDYFENKYCKITEKIRRRLETPAGIVFVFLWAFFPLVPTDAVCYVAGTTRMAFAKFIPALFLGELTLCSFYIFFAGYVWNMHF
jgi:uncharacterized membrane protein YdjX (TVP38/TMEM64 family)